MNLEEFANELRESKVVRIDENGKVQLRRGALDAEKKSFLEQNLPAIASMLSGRPETDFGVEETIVFRPREKAPSLDTQFDNYRLWLAGKGGSIGQIGNYFSPTQAEFDVMCARTRQIAEQNGGEVRLHFNYAHSWDCEILIGPNIGALLRVDRMGRINGVESRDQPRSV